MVFSLEVLGLIKCDNTRIGFSTQSPQGDGCIVVFSDIKYEHRKVLSYRTGD